MPDKHLKLLIHDLNNVFRVNFILFLSIRSVKVLWIWPLIDLIMQESDWSSALWVLWAGSKQSFPTVAINLDGHFPDLCDDPGHGMDCFSFRRTNPGGCTGLAPLVPRFNSANEPANHIDTCTGRRNSHLGLSLWLPINVWYVSETVNVSQGVFTVRKKPAWLLIRTKLSCSSYLNDASESGQIHHLCLIN